MDAYGDANASGSERVKMSKLPPLPKSLSLRVEELEAQFEEHSEDFVQFCVDTESTERGLSRRIGDVQLHSVELDAKLNNIKRIKIFVLTAGATAILHGLAHLIW